MKTLAQIERLSDLDSRVINAAALLEYELRGASGGDLEGVTLGDLVQQQAVFAEQGLLRDLNFALKTRNAIAHLYDGREPPESEKTRAAEYLVRAIALIRKTTGRDGDAAAVRSQSSDDFDEAAVQKALAAIKRRRQAAAAMLSLAIAAGSIAIAFAIREQVPPQYIAGGGTVFAILTLLGATNNPPLRRAQYYRLPGARCDNGDHRCVHCGSRSAEGRGIYTRGQYKSNNKFHECSKCKELLFVS